MGGRRHTFGESLLYTLPLNIVLLIGFTYALGCYSALGVTLRTWLWIWLVIH